MAALLGSLTAGCGIFIGDPIELFPSRADGGVTRTACFETASHMSGNGATVLDVPARDLAALVEGERASSLTWPSGSTTNIHLTFDNVKVFSVQSRINPQYGARYEDDDQCADYVRIDARIALKTDDGKLAEVVDKISFIARDGTEAYASFAIDRTALRGTYAPHALGTRCYQHTTFRVLAAFDGTHGAMIDELHGGSCEQPDVGALMNLASGHWGARWAH